MSLKVDQNNFSHFFFRIFLLQLNRETQKVRAVSSIAKAGQQVEITTRVQSIEQIWEHGLPFH